MSAIARVLVERGETVSGSDLAANERTRGLEQAGVVVSIGHDASHVAGADLVLVSSAVAPDNPEFAAASAAGIPVWRREEFLGELTAGLDVVAVAGTHGKTTTATLIAWLLHQAGRQPGYVLGADSPDLGANGSAGGGGAFVVEADEYDRAFLGLHPTIAVVTNVDYDHPDYFPTPDVYRQAFQEFVDRTDERLIVCADDPGANALRTRDVVRETYGLTGDADWHAEEIRPNAAGGSDFLAFHQGTSLGLVRTRLPGRHNVLNVLAAMAAVDAFEVPAAVVRQALTEFRGAERRFTVVGEAGDVVVIDDYGHHPTEIRSTLDAARVRYPGRDVWAVFQPHTFSRTRALVESFSTAFSDADHVVVTPIFASREKAEPGIDAAWLAERIDHPDVTATPSLEAAARIVLDRLSPPAVVVTLSAGDGNRVGTMVLEALNTEGRAGR
jgi:UDP-N-acetylmuramate--alanine ligase